MKVILPEEKALSKKQITIYSAIVITCVIAIIVAFYVQFYARIEIGRLLGFETETKLGNKTEEQIENLELEFEHIFTNQIENREGHDNKKKENDKSLVYTKIEREEKKENDYDIEVQIPYINIDHPKIEEYNQEIETFIQKLNQVIQTQNKNIIYNVEYVANVQNDILSLMIRSQLKEGANAQRVIIETFNYDLRNNKEISLEEVLRIENMEPFEVQQKIRNKIQKEQKKVEDLKNIGYNIYSRDITSKRYEVENTKVFYITKDTLYLIYAYGNENFTSEMDLVIL